jgi:peptide deformylase
MFEELQIILWPDPRLKQISRPVETFDASLRELALRMLELMRGKGVGLAAPQVGHSIRLFVMNATGQPGDDRVYVNPVLSEAEGDETGEEGCLSLPNVTAQVSRSRTLRMHAQDLDGKPIEETANGYVARIWQHETDHLNGVLITDRMGLGDRLKHRRVLRELEDTYRREHPKAPATKSESRHMSRTAKSK